MLAELLAQAQKTETKPADPIRSRSASKWQYDFVLASEMGTTKFVTFLNDREGRGWEFVGEVTLQHEGKDAPHWLFRRPAGGAKAAAADDYKRAAESLYKQKNSLMAEQDKLRALEALKAAEAARKKADPNAKEPAADLFNKLGALKKDEARLRAAEEDARTDANRHAKSADVLREKEQALEAEIALLKMQIEKLKAGGDVKRKDAADKSKAEVDDAKRLADDVKRQIEKEKQAEKAKPLGDKVKPSPDKARPLGEKGPDGRVEKKQVIKLAGSKVFSQEEVIELLTTAAKKQFGKDAPVIEIDTKSGVLIVAGSAKAVDWVTALARKLNRDE
jgi:hypothetical protein